MANLNFHINDDTKNKLEWLSGSRDETYSGTIRRLITEAFQTESIKYKEDQAFLSWQKDVN